MRTTRREILLAAGACAVAPGAARAQTDASRPLTIVVPFEAGSAADAYVRVVAEAMRPALGRAVVVENKPGAAGNIGAQAVARAPADGATILAGTMSLFEINPLIFDNPRWAMDDFTPLIKGVGAPLVFVTHPSVPARTLDEFVTWAKSRPRSLAYASFSAGSASHFLGAQLNISFGLDLEHVPYRGSASQTNELVAGQALCGFAQASNALPHVCAGTLRAIAVSGESRFGPLPDVPTFRELGRPEFTTSVWYGLAARSGTPKDALDRLEAAIVAAHASPRAREMLKAQGVEVIAQTGPDLARAISAGAQRWSAAVKASGFRASE